MPLCASICTLACLIMVRILPWVIAPSDAKMIQYAALRYNNAYLAMYLLLSKCAALAILHYSLYSNYLHLKSLSMHYLQPSTHAVG